MTYDPMNRVTLVDYPTGTDDVATTYQPDGAVDTITMGIVTLDYEYNKRRLLTGERLIWNANNWLTSYGYNANGHQATLTYRDGHQISFAPNALGQATQAGTYATGASYFPNGALKQFTYGNGIVHTLTQNARQLPERSRDLFGATAILDDTYDYDANGNVAGISDGLPGQPGNRDMSYDDLDRLVGVTAGSQQGGNAVFAYDVLDNIRQLDQGTRTVRHTYDSMNRLDTIKNAAGATLSSYDFDTRGNLTTRTTGALTDTFTFDKANRLKASTINGVASTYRYDGLGRRMQQTEAGVSSYFVYGQAGQLLFSQDGVNRFNHIHLAGSLVAKRLVPFSGGATSIRYQHTDALGSPVAETSETGAVLQRERMTAYGEPADGTWQSGSGFTGHQMDATSKLVYMQQRYYDPVSGRFLSADPVNTDPNTGRNFSRYWYADDNPHMNIDPDGRYSCKGNRAECAAVKKQVSSIRRAARRYGHGSSNRRALNRIANFYGKEGDGNNVEVRILTSKEDFAGEASTVGGRSTITINAVAHQELGGAAAGSNLGSTLVHEGNHGVDQVRYGMPRAKDKASEFWHEMRATAAEVLYFRAENIDAPSGIWTKSGGTNASAIQDQAERSTEAWCDAQGGCR